MGARALRVVGARKRYGPPVGGRLVFHDLSLDVSEGETVVLLGPSGCGKSTLLRILAGLETLTDGAVEVGSMNESGRPATGLVFQDPLLLPWLTVAENVGLGLRYRANRATAGSVDALLAEFGLDDLANRLPSQLSGGQAQRASLARTIVTGPRILLLDEPFAALDPRTRANLQQWLRAIKERHGLTVVLVTHDLDEALALGDRVMLFSTPPAEIVGTWQIDETSRDPALSGALRAEILRQYQTDVAHPAESREAYAAVAV